MKTYKVQECSLSGLFTGKGAATPCLPSAAPQHMLLDECKLLDSEGRKNGVRGVRKQVCVGQAPTPSA